MPRWGLIVLLVLAAVCAGIGVGLTDVFSPFSTAAFGWTAYSPLSATVYAGGGTGFDPAWLLWRPRLGIVLLALGAGSAGAIVAALVLRGRRATSAAD